MGSITDLVALFTQLDASVKDNRTRELLLPIREKIQQVERDQFEAEKSHHREMTDLKSQHEKEHSELNRQLRQLEAELVAAKRKPAAGPAVPKDRCPYCRFESGELLSMRPHRIFGEAGVNVGDYKCENCGKEYEKEINMRH